MRMNYLMFTHTNWDTQCTLFLHDDLLYGEVIMDGLRPYAMFRTPTKGKGKLGKGEGEGDDVNCKDRALLILDKIIHK